MVSNRVGPFSVFLFVLFINYDCSAIDSTMATGSEKPPSLSYILNEEEKNSARELIKNRFKAIIPKLEKDPREDILPFSFQEARVKSREKKVSRLQQLGFPQPTDDLKNVNVTQALPMGYVDLGSLEKYQKDVDPLKLVNQTFTWLFKMEIPGKEKNLQDYSMSKQPFAELELVPGEKDQKSKWRFNGYGQSLAYQRLFRIKEEAGFKEPPSGDTQCSIISIPALKQFLLGCIISGKFKINIIDNGMSKTEGYPTTKSNEFLPADAVFEKLAEEAKKPNYKFPPLPGSPSLMKKNHNQREGQQ